MERAVARLRDRAVGAFQSGAGSPRRRDETRAKLERGSAVREPRGRGRVPGWRAAYLEASRNRGSWRGCSGRSCAASYAGVPDVAGGGGGDSRGPRGGGEAIGHFFQSALRVAWQGWRAVVKRRRRREFTTRALVLYAMNVEEGVPAVARGGGGARGAQGETPPRRRQAREPNAVAGGCAVARRGGGARGAQGETPPRRRQAREPSAVAGVHAVVGLGGRDDPVTRDLRGGGAEINGRCVAGAFARWVGGRTRCWTCARIGARRDAVREARHERGVRQVGAHHRGGAQPQAHPHRARGERMNRTVGFLFEQWWKYVDFEPMRATLEKAVKLMQNRVLDGVGQVGALRGGGAGEAPLHALVLAPVDVQRRLVQGRERTREEARGGSEARCSATLSGCLRGGASSSSATSAGRKQQALRPAISAGDAVIRQKRKALVILGWRVAVSDGGPGEDGAREEDARREVERGQGHLLRAVVVYRRSGRAAKFASARPARCSAARPAPVAAPCSRAAEMEKKLAKAWSGPSARPSR